MLPPSNFFFFIHPRPFCRGVVPSLLSANKSFTFCHMARSSHICPFIPRSGSFRVFGIIHMEILPSPLLTVKSSRSADKSRSRTFFHCLLRQKLEGFILGLGDFESRDIDFVDGKNKSRNELLNSSFTKP